MSNYTQHISDILFHHPSLQNLAVSSVLRNSPKQQVMEVRYNDRIAFLKVFLGPNASNRWQAARLQLKQAGKVMAGDNQVVCVVAESADPPALVMSSAPGKPMREVFLAANAERRAVLVRRAGEWLNCLIHARELKPCQSWKFYNRVASLASEYASDEMVDGALVHHHMATMKQITQRLHLQPISHGVTHGDFHPENLFIAEDGDKLIVTGIDMEFAEAMPLAPDLARMLVWLASDTPLGINCKSGIDQSLFDSLCASHAPFTELDRLALHFHIGGTLLVYYLQRGANRPRVRHRMAWALKNWAKSDLNGT